MDAYTTIGKHVYRGTALVNICSNSRQALELADRLNREATPAKRASKAPVSDEKRALRQRYHNAAISSSVYAIEFTGRDGDTFAIQQPAVSEAAAIFAVACAYGQLKSPQSGYRVTPLDQFWTF